MWNKQETPFTGKHRRRKEVHAESRFAFDPTLNTRSVLSTLWFGPGAQTEVLEETTASNSGSSVDVELEPKEMPTGSGKKADP